MLRLAEPEPTGDARCWPAISGGQAGSIRSSRASPSFEQNVAKQVMFRKSMESQRKKNWKSSFQRDLPAGMPELKTR